MDRLKCTAYHADWWILTGVNDHGGGTVMPSIDGRIIWTVIGCLGNRDWLGSAELRFASAACTVIGQALRTMAAHAHVRADGVLAGREPNPSWLLDRRGAVRLANRAARQMLDDGEGPIRRYHDTIALTDAAQNHRLRQAIVAVLHGQVRDEAIIIRNGRGFARLVVESGPRYRDDCSVSVTLRSPGLMAWDTESLRFAYGLTRREAEVTMALSSGARPIEIAGALGLAHASVRVYLKRVYAKTGAEGQAPLIAMLLRGGR